MKSSIGIVLCHGWGLNAESLKPLGELLRTALPHAIVVHHSVGDPTQTGSPSWDPSLAKHWFGVGHSMGFALLQRMDMTWAGLVSLHGFGWFCRQTNAQGDTLPGTPMRVVKAMLERLALEPEQTRLDFLKRAAGSSSRELEILIKNAAEHPARNNSHLAQGLNFLLVLQPVDSAIPTLALASASDPIVPTALTQASFKGHSLQWVETQDHLAPCTDPALYADAIAQFVERSVIGLAFSKASESYDSFADVQAQIAARLAQHLQGMAQPEPASVVDLGCGTGNMIEQLQAMYPNASIQGIDIAPGMVAHCMERFANKPQLSFRQGDAQCLSACVPADVVTSSMCFQWFDDLPQTIGHWAQQCHTLALSILLDSSFAPWKKAHQDANQTCGLRRLPTVEELTLIQQNLVSHGMQATLATETFSQHSPNGLHFAKALKGIGANTPRDGHRPASLFRVLPHLPQPLVNNYDVAFLLIQRIPS